MRLFQDSDLHPGIPGLLNISILGIFFSKSRNTGDRDGKFSGSQVKPVNEINYKYSYFWHNYFWIQIFRNVRVKMKRCYYMLKNISCKINNRVWYRQYDICWSWLIRVSVPVFFLLLIKLLVQFMVYAQNRLSIVFVIFALSWFNISTRKFSMKFGYRPGCWGS